MPYSDLKPISAAINGSQASDLSTQAHEILLSLTGEDAQFELGGGTQPLFSITTGFGGNSLFSDINSPFTGTEGAFDANTKLTVTQVVPLSAASFTCYKNGEVRLLQTGDVLGYAQAPVLYNDQLYAIFWAVDENQDICIYLRSIDDQSPVTFSSLARKISVGDEFYIFGTTVFYQMVYFYPVMHSYKISSGISDAAFLIGTFENIGHVRYMPSVATTARKPARIGNYTMQPVSSIDVPKASSNLGVSPYYGSVIPNVTNGQMYWYISYRYQMYTNAIVAI